MQVYCPNDSQNHNIGGSQVIRTKHEAKARGFGFVSFLDPMDCAKAIREQNGKYLASRPMKITKSSWKERDLKEVRIGFVDTVLC